MNELTVEYTETNQPLKKQAELVVEDIFLSSRVLGGIFGLKSEGLKHEFKERMVNKIIESGVDKDTLIYVYFSFYNVLFEIGGTLGDQTREKFLINSVGGFKSLVENPDSGLKPEGVVFGLPEEQIHDSVTQNRRLTREEKVISTFLSKIGIYNLAIRIKSNKVEDFYKQCKDYKIIKEVMGYLGARFKEHTQNQIVEEIKKKIEEFPLIVLVCFILSASEKIYDILYKQYNDKNNIAFRHLSYNLDEVQQLLGINSVFEIEKMLI